MTQAEGGSVMKHLISGGDLSKWGVINAITAVANDLPDYDRATEIMELGGDLLLMENREWSKFAGAGKN